MPQPPGEAVKNATIVNTEVDYREEDDLVSAEAGTGDVSLDDHKASAKAQRERLDLITQRMQLQTKLERVERTNDILSRQNTYLLSLLPISQQLTIKAEPSDPSSSSSPATGPPPTEAQLQAELVDLKKENHALRYTFLGETSDSLDSESPGDAIKKEETEPETKIKLELDPKPKIKAEPTFENPDAKVDLGAVLQRVKELFAENTELGRLLVGEVRGSEGGGRWAEVLQESRMMISSLDDDLEQQSQEIVRLQSRISDQDKELNQLGNEVENARKAKPRSRSRSISRGRSMSRSRSRTPSVSRSRSRSGGDRSASERSYVRSRSRTRSPARSRVRSPSPRKRARPRRSRSRSRSGRRDHPASDRSPGRRRPAPAKRSEIPSRSAAVPPPRSRAGTGGSNWRDAHGISISDDEDVRGSNGKPANDPKPAGGGFSILGASSRPPPKELLPSSPLRDRRNDSPDRREYGRRGGRGGNQNRGGSRGGRSRSPRRDPIQDARSRQTQGRWREEDRNTRRPSVNERLDAPLQQGRRSGGRGPRR